MGQDKGKSKLDKFLRGLRRSPNDEERDAIDGGDQSVIGGGLRAGKDGAHHCNHCGKPKGPRCYKRKHIGWCPNGHGTFTARHGCNVCRSRGDDLLFSANAPVGYPKEALNVYDGYSVEVAVGEEAHDQDAGVATLAEDAQISDHRPQPLEDVENEHSLGAVEEADEDHAREQAKDTVTDEDKAKNSPGSLFDELSHKPVKQEVRPTPAQSRLGKLRNVKVQDVLQEGMQATASNVERRRVTGSGWNHVRKGKTGKGITNKKVIFGKADSQTYR